MLSDSRLFRSQSMSRGSLTFAKSLKKMREAPSRGTAITRDGFGEQLIDLSKHLHRSFWSSKVGGKGQKIEIEERLGLYKTNPLCSFKDLICVMVKERGALAKFGKLGGKGL